MSDKLIAKASTSIDASKDEVWKALVTPKAIKQYMFGTDVQSDFREGSKISWKGEMKGKSYEDKGVIKQCEPGRVLQYSHFSPLSGKPDKPENYHVVTIRLSGDGDKTQVSLSQDNAPDEKSRKEYEKNWESMLGGLKKYVERAS